MKLHMMPVAVAFLVAWLTVAACGKELPPPKTPEPPEASAVVQSEATKPVDASAPLPPTIRLRRRGMNLSGAEFGGESGNVPGVLGKDYVWPRPQTADYFLDRGFNHIRLPFKHERIQPKLQGPLNDAEVERMRAIVSYVTARGATVMLDAQNNYRHGTGCRSGEKTDPKCHALTEIEIGDFWGRVAGVFKGDPLVQINVTNEPHDMTTEQIAALGQAAVKEIRRVGFRGLIAVPGNGWAGAGHWTERFNGTVPSSEVMGRVTGDDVALEVHLYLDADASGGGKDCVSPTIGRERLTAFTAWLRANGRRGVLGEIGAPNTPTCEAAVRTALEYVESNYDVFESWAWWSSGEWSFGSTYALSAGPSNPAKPQLAWLTPFLSMGACPTARDGG